MEDVVTVGPNIKETVIKNREKSFAGPGNSIVTNARSRDMLLKSVNPRKLKRT